MKWTGRRTNRHAVGCRWIRPVLVAGLISLAAAPSASAQGGAWLQAIAASEFEFQRADINVPSIPFSWLMVTRYGETELTSDRADLDGVTFDQRSLSHGLFAPAMIRRRDMLLAGYFLGSSKLDFDRAPIKDGDLHTLAVGGAWLHQLKPKWMTATFVAPFLHSGLGGGSPWEVEWFAGGLVRYYQEPTIQWIFGGVYQQGFDSWFLYPYVGALWSPHPDWSLNAVMPWPSISYAVNRRWLLRVGAGPSGGQWRAQDQEQLSLDFGGWDLGLTSEVRLVRSIWLSAAAGWSGFRGFGIDEEGDTVEETDLDSEPFVRIGLNFRL